MTTFKVIFLEEAKSKLDKIKQLDKEAYFSILKNIEHARISNSEKYFKKIETLNDIENGKNTSNLYYFSAQYKDKEFKLLSFFNTSKDKVLTCSIVFLGINEKISREELEKAETIKREYQDQNKNLGPKQSL